MTTRWYGFNCQNHGAVMSKSINFKCKRMDCTLSNTTIFSFDPETCTWITCGPMDSPSKILSRLKEYRTRDEYRQAFNLMPFDKLNVIMNSILEYKELDMVGPVMCIELQEALHRRKNLKYT